MIGRPPPSTLFPYTTLFRSGIRVVEAASMVLVPSAAVMLADFGEHRSEEHTSELQSRGHLVCRRLLEKKEMAGLGAGVDKRRGEFRPWLESHAAGLRCVPVH